jgi:hypothetical protein
LDFAGHGGEARVLRQAVMVAVVDLLDDDGEFEAREGEIESNLRCIASGLSGVIVDDLLSRKAAGIIGGSPASLLQLFGI